MTRRFRPVLAYLLGALVAAAPAQAQSTPTDVAAERDAYVEWLETASNSPLTAVAQQPIGEGLRLGPPDADIPLAGVAEHRVSQRGGSVRLEGPNGARVLPSGRPLPLGKYRIAAGGSPDRRVVTIFGAQAAGHPPGHYAYDPSLVFEGTLAPPERPGRVRVLAVDGAETDAVEAGSVTVPIGGSRVRLRVRRIASGDEESELEIFFRDATNGAGTYPAGRFVSLIPLEGSRYRLDFNRARNPFCAYSTAYPCPAPWSGNTIAGAVRAGERYAGGGLEQPLDSVARPRRGGGDG